MPGLRRGTADLPWLLTQQNVPTPPPGLDLAKVEICMLQHSAHPMCGAFLPLHTPSLPASTPLPWRPGPARMSLETFNTPVGWPAHWRSATLEQATAAPSSDSPRKAQVRAAHEGASTRNSAPTAPIQRPGPGPHPYSRVFWGTGRRPFQPPPRKCSPSTLGKHPGTVLSRAGRDSLDPCVSSSGCPPSALWLPAWGAASEKLAGALAAGEHAWNSGSSESDENKGWVSVSCWSPMHSAELRLGRSSCCWGHGQERAPGLRAPHRGATVLSFLLFRNLAFVQRPLCLPQPESGAVRKASRGQWVPPSSPFPRPSSMLAEPVRASLPPSV